MKADKPFVSAVIVGAGSGTRMGGVNKALIRIGDKSAFRMVLDAFGDSALTDEIVIVCRDAQALRSECVGFDKKPLTFAEGGRTRGESVLNGTRTARKESAFYCIHDCARPLVTSKIIDAVISAALESGAATACSPVTDTVKYVDRETGTVYTPDRRHLLAVQTPQVFAANVYKISAALAKKDGITATDDTALAEHAGFSVEYVETDRGNIKLTSAEDVLIARLFEARRQKEGTNENRSRI